MDTHLLPDEEDYINMELISSPTKSFRCSSPQQTKEFEFQYFSTSNLKQSAASSADELFYKGKLLPLQRRQMEDYYSFLTCSTAPCTNSNTPLDSCNISPSESCRPSCDLNPNDFQWPPPDLHHHHPRSFKNHPRTNSWSKKLKMKIIKHSVLAQKLKSSRAYLKSLFVKSACSDASSSAENLSSKADAFNFNYSKPSKKFTTLIKRTGISDDNPHRKSFSGAIAAHSTTKCSLNSSSSSSSSTSSSFNSSGLHEVKFLRRSSSEAEIEVSIDAAIAHCKKSMQSFGKSSD